MKRYIKAAHMSGTDRISQRQLLEGLAEDLLYQVYENSPEYTLEDAYDDVASHCELVITEMDTDGQYASLIPMLTNDYVQFRKIIYRFVNQHYDDYNWYPEDRI